MTTTGGFAAIMFASGLGIPVLAAMNASLGSRLGSPAAAALCLFAVAFITTAVVVLVVGPEAMKKVMVQPRHLFLAGVLVAFYILSITYIAPHFGVGNAVFFVLLGQLVAAAIIDHYGLFGARILPLTTSRAGGIALMAVGIALTQKA